MYYNPFDYINVLAVQSISYVHGKLLKVNASLFLIFSPELWYKVKHLKLNNDFALYLIETALCSVA